VGLLVNAAGLSYRNPFLDHDGADYDSYAAGPGKTA